LLRPNEPPHAPSLYVWRGSGGVCQQDVPCAHRAARPPAFRL